jgi:hypothetical protein
MQFFISQSLHLVFVVVNIVNKMRERLKSTEDKILLCLSEMCPIFKEMKCLLSPILFNLLFYSFLINVQYKVFRHF